MTTKRSELVRKQGKYMEDARRIERRNIEVKGIKQKRNGPNNSLQLCLRKDYPRF